MFLDRIPGTGLSGYFIFIFITFLMKVMKNNPALPEKNKEREGGISYVRNSIPIFLLILKPSFSICLYVGPNSGERCIPVTMQIFLIYFSFLSWLLWTLKSLLDPNVIVTLLFITSWGLIDEALILNFAFCNFGNSFYKILYLASKRTNPSLFIVQMVWKVWQLVALIIDSMVWKGISSDDTALAFIQKIVAVAFYFKPVLSKIVFLMNV